MHIVVMTPANGLLTKLNASSLVPGRDDLAAPLLVASLERAAPAFLDRLYLDADGRRVALTVNRISVDALGMSVWEIAAPFPGRVGSLTWRSTFVYGSYPVAVQPPGQPDVLYWLDGAESTPPVPLQNAASAASIAQGIALGFTHIVPRGIDHMLFVAGLALLGTRRRHLLLLVTTFTVAHSLTLALSVLHLVSLPARIVEPLIALSIAYVGFEHFIGVRSQAIRMAVIFVFGLLHGLGFAEALAGLHLSAAALASAVLAFNVGVEAGQLTVLAATLLVLALLRSQPVTHRWPVTRLASAAVGACGLVWCVERIF
ncbi:MAG: HupE/UreJ family protein [Vicinamibacterales bacterium]